MRPSVSHDIVRAFGKRRRRYYELLFFAVLLKGKWQAWEVSADKAALTAILRPLISLQAQGAFAHRRYSLSVVSIHPLQESFLQT